MANFLSASDIAKAIKICYKIYDRCFVRCNQADVRYIEFLNDVKNLASALQGLEDAYRRVEADLRRNNLHHRFYEHAEYASERPGIGLAGDFLATVRECEDFLNKTEKFASTNSRVLRSAEFYARGAYSQMQILRERIKFHSTKILVILKPLELASHSSDSNRLARIEQQLHEHIQAQKGTAATAYSLPSVPVELADRYEQAALQDSPSGGSDDYPLNDTFNALLFHYSQSIVPPSSKARGLSTKRCNSLLKTRWILERLVDLAAYQSLPLCIVRSVVSCIEVEAKLEQSCLEAGWEAEQCSKILLLDGNWAKIWCDEMPKPIVSTAVDAMAGEMKIFDMPLHLGFNGSRQRILLFRQPRSRTEFRLLKTADDGPTLETHIDTQAERFIPIYAIPDSRSPRHAIHMYQKRFGNPDVLEFEERAVAVELQQAFTNYDVMHDGLVSQWTVTRSNSLLRKKIKGTASSSTVQIWYPKPVKPVSDLGENVELDKQSSTLVNEIVSSCMLPNACGSPSVAVQDQRGSGRALIGLQPEEPALILFTRLSSPERVDTLGYIFVPLSSGMDINRKRCGCSAPDSTCLEVVLEMRPEKRDNFKVKVHYASSTPDSEPERNWNLFLFSNPKPAEYRKLESIDTACELHLRFANVQQRKIFQYNLMRAINSYSEALSSLRRQNMTIRAKANKASDRESLYGDLPSSRSRYSVASSTSTKTLTRVQVLREGKYHVDGPQTNALNPLQRIGGSGIIDGRARRDSGAAMSQ